MTMTKMWGGVASGVGSGLGSGAPAMGERVGLCVGLGWAVDFGAQAASRQAEMTRATNRIHPEPTIRPSNAAEKCFVGSYGSA